jgi:hypothetical protein
VCYNKFIPLFKTKEHQKQKKVALASNKIEVVRRHYDEMESAIKDYYATEDGNLKVGVIISAENFLRNFAVAQQFMQPIQPVQPTPKVDSNEVGRGEIDEPRRRLTDLDVETQTPTPAEQTQARNLPLVLKDTVGQIEYRKTDDPYDYKSQGRNVLLKQGGTRHFMARGVGLPVKGFPLSTADGFIEGPVLRNDDRTGYDWIRRARVIQRFPERYVIK